MGKKQRLRNTNKEEWKKRKLRKQKANKEKLERQISKDNRNDIKKSITPYYKGYRDSKDFHLLIIVKETDNMEKLVLQKIDIGNGNILLSLPIISSEIINNFLEVNTSLNISDDKVLIDIIKSYFGIEVDLIERLTDTNTILIKSYKQVNTQKNLIVVNARPYDKAIWYKGDITTIEGFKIYGGTAIYNFFQLMENPSKIHILQHTLTQILSYRTLSNKIDKEEFLEDFAIMAKRTTLGKTSTQLHLTLSDLYDKNDDRIYSEELETKILNIKATKRI